MHSDPIADMLTRIRNGGRSRRDWVRVPMSKLKEAVARILEAEGYVAEVRRAAERGGGASLELKLRYDERGNALITDLQRISTPGLRQYFKWNEIPVVRRGLGIVIMSTSKGAMTGRDARKQQLGGEAVCAVW